METGTFYQQITVPLAFPVTSLSISPHADFAVLAAKRGLYLVDLDEPFAAPVHLPHYSKWEVADVVNLFSYFLFYEYFLLFITLSTYKYFLLDLITLSTYLYFLLDLITLSK